MGLGSALSDLFNVILLSWVISSFDIWVWVFFCLWRRTYFCTWLASTVVRDGWWEVGQYHNYRFNIFSKTGRSFCFRCLPLGGKSGFPTFFMLPGKGRTLGNSRISLGSWYFKWLLVRRVSMNFAMETNFQVKCRLQHGSDPLHDFNWQVVALLSLSFMFAEGSAFVLFLLFTFCFPSVLLKLSLVVSSLDMGRSCPFSSSLRMRVATLFLCAFFMLKIQGCFATSAPPCVPLQSVVCIHLQLSDLSQTLWKPFGV